MSGRIAFFDLDLTILACNSASLWITRELKLGYITRLQAARGAVWIGLYQLGFADMEPLLLEAIAGLKGQAEADVHKRTLDFWSEIASQVRPGAREAVARHRAAGDATWLLTSSSNYLSRPVVDLLGMDGTLCNRFEVNEGMFTGQPAGPLCFGAGKLVHARAFAAERGVSLQDCAFYTDSYSDLPVMEAVGEPVAVHPDPRLLRRAKKSGWRVETWS